jgi:transcriptional regulator with XRE-family HTH domain
MTTTTIPTFTLGDRLAKARDTAGIKSQEMAKLLDVSRTTVSNYESGRTVPTVTIVQRWSEITGVPASWIIEEPERNTQAFSQSACYGNGRVATLGLPLQVPLVA